MALMVHVYVRGRRESQNDTVGVLEIVRRSGTADPESINSYLVRLDGIEMGYVDDHRYGDGAWVLADKAMELAKLI